MAKEIRSLTGLRGIAALAVVVHHVNVFVVQGPTVLRGQPFVDLFFVLSGFVMSLAYLGRGTAPFDWRGFARARFARIYPLHLVTTVAMALSIAAIASQGGKPLDSRFTLLSALREFSLLGAMPVVAAKELWNYPSWSISVEWWTYFSVFPLILLLRARRAGAVLGAGILLLVCATAAGLYAYPPTTVFYGWLAFLRAAVGFGAGWVVWEASRRYTAAPRPALTNLLALAVIVAIYAAPAISGDDAWFLLPVYPLLIFALVAGERAHGGGWLASRPLGWLGDISYSVYLVHPLLLLGLLPLAHAAPHDSQARALFMCSAAAVLATLPVATLTYRLIEKPARQLLGRAPARAARAAMPGSGAAAASSQRGV